MILGKDLIISLNNIPISAAKSCTITRKADKIEISTPESGNAKEYVAGRTTWEITASVLVLSVANILIKVGQTYNVQVRCNGETQTGKAICTECKIDAQKGSLAKGSYKFLGSGELK